MLFQNPVLVVLGIFLLILMAKAVLIIPETHRGAVVRLGRYRKTLSPGIHVHIPFIELVTKVDLDTSIPGWQGLSQSELEAAVRSFVTLGTVTRAKGGAHGRATLSQSPSGSSEAQILAAWLVKTASQQFGIDLAKDQLAKDRIAASAQAAVLELRTSPSSCDVHLPFLAADRSGPKHFNFSLTSSKLDEILESEER